MEEKPLHLDILKKMIEGLEETEQIQLIEKYYQEYYQSMTESNNQPLHLDDLRQTIEGLDETDQIRTIERYYKVMLDTDIQITGYRGYWKPVSIVRKCGHTDMFEYIGQMFYAGSECNLCRQQRIITQKIKDADLKVLAIDQKAHDIVLKCSKGHPAYQKSYKQILADDLECPRCLKETKTE